METMSKLYRFIIGSLIIGIYIVILIKIPASAAGICEPDGQQSSGAVYRICMPEPAHWNGNLVVYAHGYVAFNRPVEIPEEQMRLSDCTLISEIINEEGYAFATTSYSTNGLAVREGIIDLCELVSIFKEKYTEPNFVYLIGVSEGGLITTLVVEQFPNIFDGGLAACGPIGDFCKQINYIGDFRVVFDYFFPNLIPGSPVDIPQDVIDNWSTVYEPSIKDVIKSNKRIIKQLLRVTFAPVDWGDPSSIERTIISLLWYNVFATNDTRQKLGGQPFDNTYRYYFGSTNDFLLNQNVKRFKADQAALHEIERHYQTSGRPLCPLVTLHTIKDQIVPYWHETYYQIKSSLNGSFLKHNNILAFQYGHCNFKLYEILVAFSLLVRKVEGRDPISIEKIREDKKSCSFPHIPDIGQSSTWIKVTE